MVKVKKLFYGWSKGYIYVSIFIVKCVLWRGHNSNKLCIGYHIKH